MGKPGEPGHGLAPFPAARSEFAPDLVSTPGPKTGFSELIGLIRVSRVVMATLSVTVERIKSKSTGFS